MAKIRLDKYAQTSTDLANIVYNKTKEIIGIRKA